MHPTTTVNRDRIRNVLASSPTSLWDSKIRFELVSHLSSTSNLTTGHDPISKEPFIYHSMGWSFCSLTTDFLMGPEVSFPTSNSPLKNYFRSTFSSSEKEKLHLPAQPLPPKE